jgi:hypothetical protein
MAAMNPDDERGLVTQLIVQSMTGTTLVAGWQLSERSFGKGIYRVHFERPIIDGGDPNLLITIRARYHWNTCNPRKLAYKAIYRVI